MNVETNVFEPQKLFYADPYLVQCNAYVEACEETKKGYEIVLNQTIFFPEGGGQPSDQGTITTDDHTVIKVLEVREKGKIYHVCDKPVPVGTQVTCDLNWERRFDYMQQHSGEHIFSGFMHEKYGFQNIGFHISESTVTVDFDGVASFEQVKEIEKKTNQYIWENHPSVVLYPSKEELKEIDYRSKMEIEGQVRLVEYPGADMCACCGTHVANTGEIGLVKIISCVNWRGGIRVEMACGRWAFDFVEKMQEQNSQISVKLSAKIGETASAVERIMNETFTMRGKIADYEAKALNQVVESFKGQMDITTFQDDLSSENVRKLCDLLMTQSLNEFNAKYEAENGALPDDSLRTCGICRVFSGNDTDGYKYAIGQINGDFREFVKKMNASLNGRGGGKPFFVQGSVMATRTEIESFLSDN